MSLSEDSGTPSVHSDDVSWALLRDKPRKDVEHLKIDDSFVCLRDRFGEEWRLTEQKLREEQGDESAGSTGEFRLRIQLTSYMTTPHDHQSTSLPYARSSSASLHRLDSKSFDSSATCSA